MVSTKLVRVEVECEVVPQWACRCSSATRSTAGGTKGCLNPDHDPLMHITEERSREIPKLRN